MWSWVQSLKEWKEVVGAFLGGVFALSAALIVARDARRRSERSAGMMLLRYLAKVRTCWDEARKLASGSFDT